MFRGFKVFYEGYRRTFDKHCVFRRPLYYVPKLLFGFFELRFRRKLQTLFLPKEMFERHVLQMLRCFPFDYRNSIKHRRFNVTSIEKSSIHDLIFIRKCIPRILKLTRRSTMPVDPSIGERGCKVYKSKYCVKWIFSKISSIVSSEENESNFQKAARG